MKKVQNLVFAEKYTTKTGEEKKKYTNIGKVFTNEEGYQSVKIEFMPLDLNKGFINIMDQKEFKPEEQF